MSLAIYEMYAITTLYTTYKLEEIGVASAYVSKIKVR